MAVRDVQVKAVQLAGSTKVAVPLEGGSVQEGMFQKLEARQQVYHLSQSQTPELSVCPYQAVACGLQHVDSKHVDLLLPTSKDVAKHNIS